MKKRKSIIIFLSMFLLIFCIGQVNSIQANAKKAKYTVKTEKVQYKDGNGRVRGVVSYQYPQFKGTSKQIKNINKAIKKKCDAYMKSSEAKSLKNYTQESIKNNAFFSKDEKYYYSTKCKVTYNKNNIVSVAMTWNWYAGGVGNDGTYGFNYNLKTGKKLTYKDVISGNAKSKVLKAAKKFLKDYYTEQSTKAYNKIKKKSSYNFYFKPKKVYICFESYELDLGASSHQFAVAGKYK